jgi:aminopeptidase N
MKQHSFLFSILLTAIIILLPGNAISQAPVFNRQDTLRGSITPERSWWDLTYYHLDIKVNPSDSTIYGTNTVTYRVLKPAGVMQIDLQEPLELKSATQNDKSLKFRREGNVYWIQMAEGQLQGKINSVVLSYGGRPRISKRPPWSGGITWARDGHNLPFVASTCQGDGASLWWPCKDHMYDEPDSMLISVMFRRILWMYRTED